MKVRNYIKKLLSEEAYSFALEEVLDQTDSSSGSVKFELARLVEKGEITNLRKGFYLILPPRYATSGYLPIQLYVDKLFQTLNRRYYVGFYSAAKFHGASHQQTHREYLMIQTPKFNDIRKGPFDLRFITSQSWPKSNVIDRKSDAGLFKLSSPALTIVDLIHHQNKLGGLNRMLATFEELAEEITPDDLEQLLTWYPNRATLQRLGFILEVLASPVDTRPIIEVLQSTSYYPVLLSPNSTISPGAVENKWKVDINIQLESDL